MHIKPSTDMTLRDYRCLSCLLVAKVAEESSKCRSGEGSWAGSGICKFVDLLGALNYISGTYLGRLDSQGNQLRLVDWDSSGTFKLVVDMKGHVNVSVMVLWNPNESNNALAKLARPKFYTCCCVVLCFPVVVLQALNVQSLLTQLT